MQRLNLKHNWFGVYHRSYLDISFGFQVLNVILNKIWPHSPLCVTQRDFICHQMPFRLNSAAVNCINWDIP